MLTAFPDATNDLTLPCHEQRAGAATAYYLPMLYLCVSIGDRFQVKSYSSIITSGRSGV